jgi:uncharacterized repeat protein (TIGR03803 family)
MRAVKYLLTLIVATALAAAAMPAMAAARSKSGPTFKYEVLYEFCALTDCADGDTPFAGPIRDAAGNLYGTTIFGGNGIYCTVNYVTGCGVVFKLDTAGNETVLYTFQGTTDGASPYSGVIRDKAGNIYGTTTGGGNGNGPDGCGVVFKVDTNGVETVLHTFTGQSTDGCHPYAGLIQDKSGNLYGSTVYGGSANGGGGVIFKVDTNGNETVLHSFTSNPDGAYPYSGLIEDEHGNFYGTTQQGGTVGGGTVYELTAGGALNILFSFATGDGGGEPYAGLIRDRAGNLYGTAQGGEFSQGVVYKVSPSGQETVLHAFDGKPDGRLPYGGLVEDDAGYYYGTTSVFANGCGGGGCGTVFQVQTNGHERTIHRFASGYGHPYSGLVRDPSGNLYGTTAGGNVFDPPGPKSGTNDCNCGTVFELARR